MERQKKNTFVPNAQNSYSLFKPFFKEKKNPNLFMSNIKK